MKKYLIVILSMVIGLTATAQSFVEDNFQNLLDADHTTVVKVSESMFQYAAIVVEDNQEEDEVNVKELLGGIKSLHLVAAEDIDNAKDEYIKGKRKIGDNYDELVSIKSPDGNFGVYIDEEDGTVYEIIAIGAEEENFFVASVLAEIRLDDISGVMSKIQTSDWKPFKKMGNLDFDELEVYPNPVSTATGLTLNIPEGMIGGEATLVNGSGATIKSFELNENSQVLDVDGITPGYYILAVDNQGVTMKKKVLVVE